MLNISLTAKYISTFWSSNTTIGMYLKEIKSAYRRDIITPHSFLALSKQSRHEIILDDRQRMDKENVIHIQNDDLLSQQNGWE